MQVNEDVGGEVEEMGERNIDRRSAVRALSHQVGAFLSVKLDQLLQTPPSTPIYTLIHLRRRPPSRVTHTALQESYLTALTLRSAAPGAAHTPSSRLPALNDFLPNSASSDILK